MGYVPCPLVSSYIRLKNWVLVGRRHETPVNPYTTIYVSPGEIERRLTYHLVDKHKRYMSYVIGGDWDRDTTDFHTLDRYRFIEQRFEEGIPWERTEYYSYVLEMIEENGEFWHGCRSEADVKARCESLEQIHHDMKENGYRTAGELSDSVFATVEDCIPNEVKVNVGRDGEFIYETGAHRLSMAKVLGLDRIPVQVMIRHERWQRKRDDAVRNPAASAYTDHPDVEYLT